MYHSLRKVDKSTTGIQDFICLKECNLNTSDVDFCRAFLISANNDWIDCDSEGRAQPELWGGEEVVTSAVRAQLKLTGPGAELMFLIIPNMKYCAERHSPVNIQSGGALISDTEVYG